MTYEQACDRAREQSKEGVTQHVNALILGADPCKEDSEPVLDKQGYGVSDWFDGSTVASFYNGVKS